MNAVIETVKVHTELQQRIKIQQLFSQITRQISQTFDLEEILQTVVDEVRQFLQTDRVLIFQLQSEGWGTVIKESVAPQWSSHLSTSFHDSCLNTHYFESFRQGLITLKSDIYDGSITPCHVELLAKLQVRANLVVPIRQKHQLWGLLIAHHCASPRQWQELEINLLQELTYQVGITLQQAELHQQTQNELLERKRVEVELRESEQRFRQMAENIDAVFWIVEMPGHTVLYVSPAYQRLWGWKPEELYESQQVWINHIHPEDRESVALAFAEKAARGRFNEEYRIILSDGTIRWVRDRCFPILDQNGQIYRFTGIAEDITNRKQIEQALQYTSERLVMALDATQMGVWDWDLLTNKVVWTPDHEILLGYEPGTPHRTYQDWAVRVHPDDLVNVETIIQASIVQQQDYQCEYRVIWPNGSLHWVSALGRCHFEQGQPVRMIGMMFEISDRKFAQQKLEQLLVQEQLARKEAEYANRIKDDFLAILSHELRSPLNPILGWAKLLKTRNLDAAKREKGLETIERNVKLQVQLIDDLLDIAKILHGKLSIDMTPVDLVFIINSALDTVKTAAIAKSIDLSSVLPPIGQVSGDAARLQQIIWNLLSNAIKFTPNHGEVEIRLQQIDNQAQITVRDTGKGISPLFLPHIFESFRQEDTSTTRKSGGLGLGLTIVRQLVEAHGGTITADSPGEGLGATFTVSLSLLNMTLPIQSTDKLSSSEFPLTGIRVLTVDDEVDTRCILEESLCHYGAEVLAVASAVEVLNSLESFQPDVLISDIGMPDIDGYTLIQHIRTLPSEKGGQTPAIALTAYAREYDYHQAIISGYQMHIKKPVQLEQLVQAVVTLTANREKIH